MATLFLVAQIDDGKPHRELNMLGDKIVAFAKEEVRQLFCIRTNNGSALATTTSVQASVRSFSFDDGHTKVRVLWDEPCAENYDALVKLFGAEIFPRHKDAVAIFVGSRDFCVGFLSHLLPSVQPAEFDWSLGHAAIIDFAPSAVDAKQF